MSLIMRDAPMLPASAPSSQTKPSPNQGPWEDREHWEDFGRFLRMRAHERDSQESSQSSHVLPLPLSSLGATGRRWEDGSSSGSKAACKVGAPQRGKGGEFLATFSSRTGPLGANPTPRNSLNFFCERAGGQVTEQPVFIASPCAEQALNLHGEKSAAKFG